MTFHSPKMFYSWEKLKEALNHEGRLRSINLVQELDEGIFVNPARYYQFNSEKCNRFDGWIDTNGKLHRERIYLTPKNKFVPSVTSILKATEDPKTKARIERWKHKLIEVHGVKKGKELQKTPRERGVIVHKQIQEYWENKKLPSKNDFETAWFYTIKEYLDSIEPDGVEEFVWTNKWAGTLDYRYEQNVIGDFKTSSTFKRREWMKKAFIQCTAYALGVKYTSTEKLEPTRIEVVVIQKGKYQIFREKVSDWINPWMDKVNTFHGQTKLFKELNKGR